MARIKVKKDLVGQQIKISPNLTIVFSEYMSDCDYEFALGRFPDYFDIPKIKKDVKDK